MVPHMDCELYRRRWEKNPSRSEADGSWWISDVRCCCIVNVPSRSWAFTANTPACRSAQDTDGPRAAAEGAYELSPATTSAPRSPAASARLLAVLCAHPPTGPPNLHLFDKVSRQRNKTPLTTSHPGRAGRELEDGNFENSLWAVTATVCWGASGAPLKPDQRELSAGDRGGPWRQASIHNQAGCVPGRRRRRPCPSTG